MTDRGQLPFAFCIFGWHGRRCTRMGIVIIVAWHENVKNKLGAQQYNVEREKKKDAGRARGQAARVEDLET